MFNRRQTLTEKILAGPISKSGWRGLTFMASLFLSGDYLKQKGSLTAAFARTAYSMTQFGAIHDFTEAVNKIDDILDSMPGEEICLLGSVNPGTEICDFLKNPRLDPDLYMKTMDRLIEHGLTDRDTAHAFTNLFATLMHTRGVQEAALQKNYREAPARRHSMSELTIQTTQAYTVFIFRCLNRYKNDYGDVSTLDFNQATAPYPDIARLARLAQIMDDLRDFFTDVEDELVSGVASPNYFLARMAEQQTLMGRDGKLNADLRAFISWNGMRNEAIPMSEAPKSVRDVIMRLETPFCESLRQVRGDLSQSIIRAYFYDSVQEGFKTRLHPDVMEKQEIESAQQADLALRMTNG